MLINFDCYHFFPQTVPLFHSEAVVGSEARLPCNLTSPITGDRVSLVIWYKEGQSTPIYSFDVRHTEQLDKGSHHEGNGSLNGRSHFNTTLLPSFVITNVKGQDNGLYRCRADFVKSPTRNIKIQLNVIGEWERDFNFLVVVFVPRSTSATFKVFAILFLIRPVPPENVLILNEKGVHIPHYILGPYNEGASINITCVSTGGKREVIMCLLWKSLVNKSWG